MQPKSKSTLRKVLLTDKEIKVLLKAIRQVEKLTGKRPKRLAAITAILKWS